MEDITSHVIPQFLDLKTYRSYYKAIRVPYSVVIILKEKFIQKVITSDEIYYAYPNRIRHGICVKVCSTNNIISFKVTHYRNGNLNGPCRVFTSAGFLQSESFFVNGLIQGIQRHWAPSIGPRTTHEDNYYVGQLMCIEKFVNGLPQSITNYPLRFDIITTPRPYPTKCDCEICHVVNIMCAGKCAKNLSDWHKSTPL